MPKLKIRYIKDKQGQPLYINGATGGLTPKGEISVSFFSDVPRIPDSQEFNLDNTGRVIGEIKSEDSASLKVDDISIDRHLTTEVFFSVQTAKDLQAWLGRQIDAHTKMSNIPKQ